VVGVPMHFAATDERSHLAEVGRRLARGDRFHVIGSHLTPADAKGIFAAATAAFGISYHSAIFSLSSGTPFLGLYHGAHYTQKMRGLSELYDLPELAVPVEGTTPKAFARLLLARLERKDSVRRHLLARHEALVKQVYESRRRFLERVCLTSPTPDLENTQREWIDQYLAFEFEKKDTEVFWNVLHLQPERRRFAQQPETRKQGLEVRKRRLQELESALVKERQKVKRLRKRTQRLELKLQNIQGSRTLRLLRRLGYVRAGVLGKFRR